MTRSKHSQIELPLMQHESIDGSVTQWLDMLKSGNLEAAGPIWNAYFDRIVSVARGRIRANARGAADEEDVAVSAFDSFFRGVANSQFPRLNDRNDLWQLLFVITSRKTISHHRRESREKRGGGNVVHASSGESPEGGNEDLLAGLADLRPDPAFSNQLAEECQRLLSILNDGQLAQLAIWKMEGFTNEEIALKLDRSIPTVERKVARIRKMWERETPV